VLALASLAPAVFALGPEDVYILVNKNVADSQAVADHYCDKRGVPKDHVVALDLPAGEDINRADYDAKLAGPLREQLKDKKDKVKVLLTVYGVPLRVGPQLPNDEEKAELDKIKKEMEPLETKRKDLDDEIKALQDKVKDDAKGDAADDLKARQKDRADLENQLRPLEQRRRLLSHDESQAAVDSELALLWRDAYELRRWQINPLYFQVPEDYRKEQPPLLMTCRLDAPSVELVKRIIDTSVEVEAKGLEGKVYVDARGIKYNPADEPGFGYGGYDESMREMAKLLDTEGKMPVTLDDKPELFAPDSCPDCALYCGWYSLANYVPCCKFVPGAVAWHLASSEAVSLRDPKSKLWCKNLLENGAVATLGPVAEPYTIGFPKPAEFFGCLATGKYTLVECYWRTEMFASWMTVLVGDPLYNPYAKAPKLKPEQVKPSPAGGRFPFVKDKEGK
jgi:uncharacterized protein (TIGR03790 family)